MVKTQDYVRIPGLRRLPWVVGKKIELRIEMRRAVIQERTPELQRKIEDLFNNESLGETEGNYFWVPDYFTPHMGPCMFCIEMERRFMNKGAPLELLEDIRWSRVMVPGWGLCMDWHQRSHLQPTYSRVLDRQTANSVGQGRYGMDSRAMPGDEDDWLPPSLQEKIRQIVRIHRQQDFEIAESRAMLKVRLAVSAQRNATLGVI